MATRKVTVSLDATALMLAERAASREGLSMSAWISRAARREAVRTGVDPSASTADDRALVEAQADEVEAGEAERQLRAAG